MKYRKVLLYLICLLPWFLGGFLFKSDSNYYYSLTLPFFAPQPFVFAIVWPILYLLIAYSIYQVVPLKTSNYKIYLFINYVANQLYSFCFFTLKNNFLSFVDVLIVLISSMYLYVETKSLSQKDSKYLIPYIIWNVFALVLSFSIYVMNL